MAVALSSLFSMPNSHVGIPQTFRRTLPFSGNWRERRTRSDQRCIANLFASPSMNSMATSSKRDIIIRYRLARGRFRGRFRLAPPRPAANDRQGRDAMLALALPVLLPRLVLQVAEDSGL